MLNQAWLARCVRVWKPVFDCIYNEYIGENSEVSQCVVCRYSAQYLIRISLCRTSLPRYLYVAGSDGEDTSSAAVPSPVQVHCAIDCMN